jgi:hypothetical protein
MASSADYGSTFGFIVFVQELALLAYCFLRSDRSAGAEEYKPPQDRARTAENSVDDKGETLDADTRFLFEVVARQNEAIVHNIDALDGALIAVVVGTIAIALFAADKWFDLNPNLRFAAFCFLSESAVAALLGYSAISFTKEETIDDAAFRFFVIDFAKSPLGATSSAIAGLTHSAKANMVARRYKQTFIIIATVLALIAAAVIVAGRSAFAMPGY